MVQVPIPPPPPIPQHQRPWISWQAEPGEVIATKIGPPPPRGLKRRRKRIQRRARRAARLKGQSAIRSVLSDAQMLDYRRWGCVFVNGCRPAFVAGCPARVYPETYTELFSTGLACAINQYGIAFCPRWLTAGPEIAPSMVLLSPYVPEDSFLAMYVTANLGAYAPAASSFRASCGWPGRIGSKASATKEACEKHIRRAYLKGLMKLNEEEGFWDPTPIPFPAERTPSRPVRFISYRQRAAIRRYFGRQRWGRGPLRAFTRLSRQLRA